MSSQPLLVGWGKDQSKTNGDGFTAASSLNNKKYFVLLQCFSSSTSEDFNEHELTHNYS